METTVLILGGLLLLAAIVVLAVRFGGGQQSTKAGTAGNWPSGDGETVAGESDGQAVRVTERLESLVTGVATTGGPARIRCRTGRTEVLVEVGEAALSRPTGPASAGGNTGQQPWLVQNFYGGWPPTKPAADPPTTPPVPEPAPVPGG